MAVNREPILKRCKSLGISPAVMGIAKETKRDPNANKRKKVSEYGMQLKEKLKFIYGVLEKQFRHLFELAEKMEGQAGANLITLLESRLDNVVYRMGLSMTRREARQLVVHGHYLVNGKRVDIPSYRIKEGDVISLKENSKKSEKFKQIIEANASKAQISTEHILPHHAVIKTRQAILGIRRIHRHQIKALKLQRNHTPFLIMLLLPQAIGNSQRLNLRKLSSTAVALALRTVPILLIAGEHKISLLTLHLRFLQTNNIRCCLLQKFGKALRHAGTQTVNIPGIRTFVPLLLSESVKR